MHLLNGVGTTGTVARKEISQSIALLKPFIGTVNAISEPQLLDLLALADQRPITNEDVRKVLRLKGRMSAWRRLSALTRLNLLEKKRHEYRTTPYARDLMATMAKVFEAMISGEQDLAETVPKISEEVIGIAMEGLKFMYMRGEVTESEFEARLKAISEAEAAIRRQP